MRNKTFINGLKNDGITIVIIYSILSISLGLIDCILSGKNLNFIMTISSAFLGYIVFKITRNKMLKYILTPVVSLIYWVMLSFAARHIRANNFYILILVPILIVGIMIIINYNLDKKK